MEGQTNMTEDNQPKANKMTKLNQYMKARANFENLEWELSEELLKPFFEEGIRVFFGVELDDEGNLISDAQQPSFFMSYKSTSLN